MRNPKEEAMDPRIEEALRQFDEVHAEVVAFVRDCDEHDWRETGTVEGWPVGVIAHHIATGYTTAMAGSTGCGSTNRSPGTVTPTTMATRDIRRSSRRPRRIRHSPT